MGRRPEGLLRRGRVRAEERGLQEGGPPAAREAGGKAGSAAGVKAEDFGRTEWIRFTLDYKPEDLIPKLGRGAAAEEIFRHLVEFQGKLAGVYARIAETIVSRGQKELFESLARFKNEQGAEVHRLQENYRPD